MIQKIDNATVREAVQQAYERCKNETGGKNADYIPYLANVPSTLFGIAACLPDGEVIAVGDTDYKFGIESVSKVPTAILAMNQYSAQEVLTKIGADATGLPFNSIMAILLENDHPSTPLVNAGAISACSMVQPVGDSDGKWKAITGFIEGLAGSQVEVIDELYKSETATNFNNKSIAWLLKNYNRIYDDPDMALDIYTRQCSIGVTAKQLATMAATIANGGKNPVTKQQVFKPELSPKIASMMATVGFYEHTGDWLFTTGLPAKTGVGGGIVINGKPYVYTGIYASDGNYIREMWHTNFMVDTDIPRLGLGFSFTFQCRWRYRQYNGSKSSRPFAYFGPDGVVRAYTDESAADPYLKWLVRSYNEAAYRWDTEPFSMTTNLKVTKRLFREKVMVAMFITQMFNYMPSYKIDGVRVRRHASPYFGMEVNFRL